ncbi:hypothetical protein PY365_14770 [Roseiarcaceae bacterium H3SJ34-1]|uniref:hypothetical protein n=1 Tax=Terripilifer ovatus TaxID=3032367 RepID=UPI003AB93FD1|nr:hypothetical protein [Roseiarcaceae bacterium H3SJ34-1]
MSYTVKLALFPAWKAPSPYETLDEIFATMADASRAAELALAPITDRELAEIAPYLHSRLERNGEQPVTAITVPDRSVHGYLIYDEAGVEVSNWTTLDVAVERAASR